MNRKVYISRLSSFLPNAPVDNDEMENILGYVGGTSFAYKKDYS